MQRIVILGIAALPFLHGCRSEKTDLMPLSEKSHWNYIVRSVNSYTDHVSVSRRIAVGDTNGFELKSNLGISHLGWSHGRLISDQMAGANFEPPITLLAPNEKSVLWRGYIQWGDKKEPGKATTVNVPAKIPVNGVTVATTQSTVTIKLPNRIIELIGWFKPGLGLVRQDQRTNGRVDVFLEYLDQS